LTEKNPLIEKKNELIEKLGVHLECSEQLAPVAARILSYLILTGKKGASFEELLINLCASKSTISTQLSNLQNLKKITYYTKPGDRKKYFTTSTEGIIQAMNTILDHWKSKKEIHLEIMDYKKNYNKIVNENTELKFDFCFHDDYLQYMEEASSSILKIKNKLLNNNKNKS